MTDNAISLSECIDGMLGKPFLKFGRGPNAYYCLGILLDLLERVKGIKLEDPFVVPDESVLRGFWKQFIELPCSGVLQPLDVIFYRWGEHEAHVSVVENDRWAVTASQEFGVVRMLLANEIARAQKYYRLKALL